MSLPTLKVEIAFGYGPFDTAAVFTDVTAYVRNRPGVHIRRGVNDPADPRSTHSPGRATFTLDNSDRRFDPLHSAGPHFGDIKPRVQMRITGIADYDNLMFTGWVSSWPQGFSEAGLIGTVDVVCYDAIEMCGTLRLTSDPVADWLDGTGYSFDPWFRQSSPTNWINSTGVSTDAYVSGDRLTITAQQSQPLAPNLKSQPIELSSARLAYTDLTGIGSAVGYTWSVWVQSSALSGTPTDLQVIASDLYGHQRLYLRGDGYVGITFDGYDYVSTVYKVADSLPHHIVVTIGTDNITRIYADGQLVSTTGVMSGTTPTYFCFLGADSPTAASPSYFQGRLQDFLVIQRALTAAEVAEFYALCVGFLAESVEDRMHRYLDDAGWPAAWRNVSTATRATVGQLVYDGQELITALRELERSEQGRLYAAKDGMLTLLSRYAHQEDLFVSAPVSAFDDAGSIFSYETFGWSQDDTLVRNDITVTNPTTQSRSQDSTSQDTYGRRSETINTILSTYEQCRDMAAGLVYWWKNAATRIEPFKVARSPEPDFQNLLYLDLGYMARVTQTPLGVGSPIVVDLLVNFIEWDIQPEDGQWSMTIGGSERPPLFFVVDETELDDPDYPLGF